MINLSFEIYFELLIINSIICYINKNEYYNIYHNKVPNLKKYITFNTIRNKIELSIKSLSYIISLFVPLKFMSFPDEIHEKFLFRRNFKLPTSIAISIPRIFKLISGNIYIRLHRLSINC